MSSDKNAKKEESSRQPVLIEFFTEFLSISVKFFTEFLSRLIMIVLLFVGGWLLLMIVLPFVNKHPTGVKRKIIIE